MSVSIREAGPGDVDALVRLRLENARRHVDLGPDLYRLPDADAVRDHFADRLRDGPDGLVLLAEVGGATAGMAEVVLHPEPPDHQILVPWSTADVHTVIFDGFRRRGVGRALLAAAERTALDHGAVRLRAAIFAPNEAAVGFYAAAGFGPHGILLAKDLDR